MSVNKVSDFSRVNQRLLQSGFLLQQARDLSNQHFSPLHHEAALNAVLLHLQLALVFYWREIGSYCQLKMAWQFNSLDDLQTELQKQNRHSRSVEELMDLKLDKKSWLYRLQYAIDQLSLSVTPQPEAKAFVTDDNIIPLVQLQEDTKLELDDLAFFIDQLTLLIQRQRNELAEF
jgi:hypothetical protein